MQFLATFALFAVGTLGVAVPSPQSIAPLPEVDPSDYIDPGFLACTQQQPPPFSCKRGSVTKRDLTPEGAQRCYGMIPPPFYCPIDSLEGRELNADERQMCAQLVPPPFWCPIEEA
jgi:hypothetical protein